MATTQVASERGPATAYRRLEERILARDQIGASGARYELFKQERPVTEIIRETVRIHAPYTHVPYHQRLDDGVVKFVTAARDVLLLAAAKHTAGHRKYGDPLEAYRRFTEALG